MPRSGDALGGRRRGDPGSRRLSQPDGRFETEWLTRSENLAALADLPGRWIDKVHERRPPRIIELDMGYGRMLTNTITQATGWAPSRTVETTLDDVLEWLGRHRAELEPLLA